MAQFDVTTDPISADSILIEETDHRTVAIMAATIWADCGVSGTDASYDEIARDATRLFAATQLAIVYHNKGRLADTKRFSRSTRAAPPEAKGDDKRNDNT